VPPELGISMSRKDARYKVAVLYHDLDPAARGCSNFADIIDLK
jgi:hypothetical protein